MNKFFEEFGLNLTEEKISKFELYRSLLKKYNQNFNITAISDDEEINVKHFLDSAVKVDNFSTAAEVIEVGSGGGFPSIPIKIMRDDLKFTLIEATGKKCEFLRIVVKELELKNVTVINGRAEELGRDENYREKFDYAIARAVARLNVLSEYCLPFVKKGGEFIAYKGRAGEEISEAKKGIEKLGGKIKDVYSFELPLNAGERNIIRIEKVSLTPEIYPRSNGKIKKSPLGL